MNGKCVGFIETWGLASALEAADTAVKTANVHLIGYEYNGYDATIVVKIEGDVSAVKAASRAASKAAWKIQGSLRGCVKYTVKPLVKDHVYHTLVDNVKTVGTEQQMKSGKRPQGTGKRGKWIGHWNPKECYIYE